MANILIVEDEQVIRSALKQLLEYNDYTVSEAGNFDEALEAIRSERLDLIITDVRLPGGEGTSLIEEAKDIPVLVMTSYASMRSAVNAMKRGAVDYLAKPFDHDEMLSAIESILIRQRQRSQLAHNGTGSAVSSEAVENDDTSTGGSPRASVKSFMYGDCEQMLKLFTLIEKVAPTDSTVLIQGESGTGKELAAKALHALSRRHDQTLISVNCAAIPETLIESELFGHEKGAFTGAASARRGLIEAADGGTLFLDEIGELPLEAQARLLRVLQEGEIRRVGSTQSRQVDVRLLAATHRNLKAMTRNNEFREDLFYRLNVMPLKIPPLRDRGDDILLLADKLLQKLLKRMDKPGISLTQAARQAIAAYDWPGNVRELENALERAIIVTEAPGITPDLLDIDFNDSQNSYLEVLATGSDMPKEIDTAKSSDLSLEDYFQHFVLENQDTMSETELAKKLGISRKNLWERRQRLSIPRPKKSG
ncbi:sigma-54 dependent transcriptional regulator [Allohahella marinimesophila]|uniref:Two-component system response regulator CbrB n=1 Tax=Allohahella marinimesophila TaxID=1054972 RepID=A0ABP7P5J9_9GAMM